MSQQCALLYCLHQHGLEAELQNTYDGRAWSVHLPVCYGRIASSLESVVILYPVIL